jgi:glycolate oxidase FAD binding subunit
MDLDHAQPVTHAPQTPGELAEALGCAASRKQSIALAGASTKRLMGGPVESADVSITTRCLNRVLLYEPHDLTISVEAGISYRDLSRVLAENNQMIPLDPPYAAGATIGGVLAANVSGPRRRLYGTARDLVIGMQFATLQGKLVQSGGMVVKNVAGLDMAKLMIGSFGTLAAIAVANFKLLPKPAVERTFLLLFDTAERAFAARDAVLRSVLQPAAVDLLNPAAAEMRGRSGFVLAIQSGGNALAVERYERTLRALGDMTTLEGPAGRAFWTGVREFAAAFMATTPDGAVVRVSCTLKELRDVLASTPTPILARAGSGVSYAGFETCLAAAGWSASAAARGWKCVIEYAPESRKKEFDLWPSPGGDIEVMKRVKDMFDPQHLLNRGRLYRRI